MGGFFTPATLEQIRAASDIVDIIGGYIPLKRNGANFVALCPFHREKTPSFNVNSQKQIFHCFGCHKGGDVFSFVKEYENIDFPDAVRRLAERAHIPIETESQGGSDVRHIKDRLLQLHEQITQRWQAALAAGEAGQTARDYLAKRGVSEEAVKLFRLGCAPEAWDDTVNWAKSKQYEMSLMEQAGLIVRKEGSDHYYDRFRGRLIFPICDEQGRVVAFSGRILAGDEKTAKYVNSPETPIFTKGKVMFGLDKSKRSILEAQYVIICEGQVDLIACFMSGVKNVVAPQGTALTSDHARILARYAREAVLCFDSDSAGQNATVRSLETLLTIATRFNVSSQSSRERSLFVTQRRSNRAYGLALRVATLPSPHDPDSFIKTFGAEPFRKLIVSAPGFFDYYLDRLSSIHNSGTDSDRRAIVQGMAEALQTAATGDELLRDTYAQKTALRLGVAMEATRKEFAKGGSAVVDESSEAEGSKPAEISPQESRERWLLRFLLRDDEHVEWVADHLQLEWIQNPTIREIVGQRLLADGWPGLTPWLSQQEDQQLVSFVTEVLSTSLIKEVGPTRKFAPSEENLKGPGQKDGIIKLLRDDFISKRVAALSQSLTNSELPEPTQTEILTEIQRLRQLKKLPLTARSDEDH